MKSGFEIPSCETCMPRLASVFDQLTKEELEGLAMHKGCNFHKKGQVLFYEGNTPTGLYCMNRGKVKLYKTDEFGKVQIVRLAKEGDVLGYRALLTEEPYSGTAEVLEDASICFIPRDSFFRLLKDNPAFSLRVIQLMGHELGKAEERELSLSRKPVRERMAETILMLEEFYGFEEDGKTLRGAMTREDLANIVGTATETVIRLLSEMKAEEIIDLDKKKIKILNRGALVKTANVFD